MNESHELAEKIEEAGEHGHHGGHGKGGIGKYVGLTMAVIGVLLALCSANVGAERTELVKTMVEQSTVYTEYQAASTKYRVMMAQIQQTYAVTPSRHLTEEAVARLDQLPVPKDAPEGAALQKAALRELMGLLQPRKVEVETFLATIARYDEERRAVRAWAESFDDVVRAHFEGAEHFETAQLLAEIGIVLGSIALLRASRPFWFASIAAGVVCALLTGRAWVSLRAEVHEGVERQEQAKERYEELRGQKDANGKHAAELRDEETLAKVRERFAIAAPAHAEAAPAEPARH